MPSSTLPPPRITLTELSRYVQIILTSSRPRANLGADANKMVDVWGEMVARCRVDGAQHSHAGHGFHVSPHGAIMTEQHMIDIICRVAIKGMTAPRVTMETAMTLKAFQVSMSPLRKSWGALAMTSDSLVCGVSKSLVH